MSNTAWARMTLKEKREWVKENEVRHMMAARGFIMHLRRGDVQHELTKMANEMGVTSGTIMRANIATVLSINLENYRTSDVTAFEYVARYASLVRADVLAPGFVPGADVIRAMFVKVDRPSYADDVAEDAPRAVFFPSFSPPEEEVCNND